MKYFLTFLFGAAAGAAGALIWLRKDIKKQLESIKNGEDLPFEMNEKQAEVGQNGGSEQAKTAESSFQKAPVAVTEETKIAYNKIVEQVKNGPKTAIPVMPRDDISELAMPEEIEEEAENRNIRGEVFFEIDKEEFENDTSNEKERLIFFQGDKVVCTENGTIISNPYLLIGNQWDQWVGNFADHTAFVRNNRLATDYEIFVENGTYTDEYGLDSM